MSEFTEILKFIGDNFPWAIVIILIVILIYFIINPEKIEKNLLNLRKRYMSDGRFRKIWDFFMKISSTIMKIDAKYHSLKKAMNIGLIFRKV